jgi:hypothetical protein
MVGIFEIGFYLFLKKPGLASNCDPPDLCYMSSYDYRHKSPMPGCRKETYSG